MDAVTPARRDAGDTGTEMLFCVARGHGAQWEGLCLDLDIAVQGRSFDEVKDRLQLAVAGYVETAMVEAEPARSQLLRRRAPFLVRLRWGVRFLLTALLRGRSTDDATVGFPVSCRA
jgi:hypothetical protein